MNYKTALTLLHEGLNPASYVEIGCREGNSLGLANCPSVAIDPEFEIRTELRAPTRIFRQTSDDFFATQDLEHLLGGKVELAFVDGMHNSEYVLRDILNLEKHARHDSVVVIDDVLPQDIAWTSRERQTRAWTGDVYKVIPFLRKHRPDLSIHVFDITMKGMAVITGFDPGSRLIQTSLAEHEAVLAGDEFACNDIEELRRTLAPEPTSSFAGFVQDLRRRRGDPALAVSRPDTDLYLDLLKRSLLNEIYLDDELRLLYLRDCLDGSDSFDYAVLHDIRVSRKEGLESLAASRRIGRFPDRKIHRSGFSHTMMGRLRLDSLHACLDDLHSRRIAGDLIECGVWRGGGCILMAGWLKARGITDRRLLVADSFEGLPLPSNAKDRGLDLSKDKYPQLAVSLETVRENFAAYGLLDDARQRFLKGWFRDTLSDAPTERIALLRMDGDLYESTMDTLMALYDRVAAGGIVIVDDYGALKVCRQALEDFFEAKGTPVPEMTRIDWTGAFFMKPF
ncbi:class I SAM-dependent methyltransferase [Jiella pelagia]|uniref:Class I SAM-dependent methyltransferase n=1 Tax=Jiella pelagia TaxID=2986949 RepID=A0ABY7BVN4_9HYPH|nr:TylF/MycF/NovP-related O-methyltransferase [Jiella pelagia]WAP67418.1 class I SAM-dependent methyltransferase [Jiella pelagia]